MSWSQVVAGRRFAVDGQFTAALAAARASVDTPAAQQSLGASAAAVADLLRAAPTDCDVYIRLTGHRGNAGNGEVAIIFAVRAHQNPGEDFNPEAAGRL